MDATNTAPAGAPQPTPDDDLQMPLRHRLVTLLGVILPVAALVVAIILAWGHGVDWVSISLFVGMYILTGLGVTVGYHRLFTHRSFQTNRTVQGVLGVLGSMAMEGPLLRWVATHRRHHQHSDHDEDPHSPHANGAGFWNMVRGMWRAHVGWVFEHLEGLDRYVADYRNDRFIQWISKLFPLWVVLGVLIPGGIALAITGTWMGFFLGVLWGGLVRIFFVHHVTWSINSVCHIWGSQPFRSHDESRNNPIFGILGFGEGWHNNHHAFPTSARHGLRWWQVDTSYLVILAMSKVGLAQKVRVPPKQRVEAKRR